MSFEVFCLDPDLEVVALQILRRRLRSPMALRVQEPKAALWTFIKHQVRSTGSGCALRNGMVSQSLNGPRFRLALSTGCTGLGEKKVPCGEQTPPCRS